MEIPAQHRWVLDEDSAGLLDGLPEPFQEACSGWKMEELVAFLFRHQGQSVYLPSLEHLVRTLRATRIRREFNGTNHRELARKYGVSLTHVYQVISERDET